MTVAWLKLPSGDYVNMDQVRHVTTQADGEVRLWFQASTEETYGFARFWGDDAACILQWLELRA